MKALVIGESKINIIAQKNGKVNVNGEFYYDDFIECGSGSACNVAYALGKYKLDSYLASVVGDDSYGTIIKKELEEEGVHTEYVETAYEKRTSISFITIDPETKEKVVNNISKEKLLLKKSEVQFEPDIIYTDGYDYGATLSLLNRFPERPSVIGAKRCDKEVLELCKYCKYIIASKEFAEWLSGTKIDFNNPGSLVTVYSTMLNKLVRKEIIITLEDQGALYINNNQIKVMPGLKLDVKDTTGSGDIFRAAFIYAITQNYDIEKMVTFANIAAGLTCGKIGTREAVPEMSEIMTYFKQKYPDQVVAPAETPTAAPTPAPETTTPASTAEAQPASESNQSASNQ